MVFSCFAVYNILVNNTGVGHTQQLKYGTTHVLFASTNTAYNYGILDEICVIKNNQPFIKIGKSSKLFVHDCPIPMCAS